MLMLVRIYSIILFCLFSCDYAHAQQTKPQLEATASVNFGLIEGYPLVGFGSHLKSLWSVGKKGDALVASLGFDRLYEGFEFNSYDYTFLLTSIGYRKRIKSAFIEPKLGLGFCNDFDEGGFTGFIGVEPGIEKKKFRFSIDYRFIATDGFIQGDHFHTFAFRMGYRIL